MPRSSIAVGIDLVCIADVKHSLARYGERYTGRLFTEDEIAYCSGKPQLAGERYAARFAAKEATTKLLRIESDAMLWRSIEVQRHVGGWCDILLHDEAAELARSAGIDELALSMSHEHDYAIATVVAYRSEQRLG